MPPLPASGLVTGSPVRTGYLAGPGVACLRLERELTARSGLPQDPPGPPPHTPPPGGSGRPCPCSQSSCAGSPGPVGRAPLGPSGPQPHSRASARTPEALPCPAPGTQHAHTDSSPSPQDSSLAWPATSLTSPPCRTSSPKPGGPVLDSSLSTDRMPLHDYPAILCERWRDPAPEGPHCLGVCSSPFSAPQLCRGRRPGLTHLPLPSASPEPPRGCQEYGLLNRPLAQGLLSGAQGPGSPWPP